jgi:hypothetical protein
MNLLTAQYGATISWVSSHEALINPTTGAVTPVDGSQTTVTLTATITKGLETDTKVFTIKVGQVPLSTVLQVRAAAVNDLVRFNGLLLMGDNNRTFVVHDATAAVMLFTADAALLTQLNANLGKEVSIEGTRSASSGQMVQVINFTVTVLGDAVNVPLELDYSGLSLLAVDMLPYQGYLMSYEGLIVVSNSTSGSNNTTVTLRNLEGQTISIFRSNFAVVPAEEVTYLKALTPGTVVNIVDAVVGWFNNPQFYYTAQAQVVTVTEISNEHKVYFDATALTQPAALTEATTLTLPVTGTNGSVIAWSSSDEALVNSTTGAVVMPVSGQVTVYLTATVSIGEVSRTVDFEMVLGTAEAGTQFTETFETDILSTYSDGTFNGVEGVVWTYVHARNVDTFAIDGTGIMLRRGSEPSSLTGSFTGGISSFTFDTRKAYTGDADRQLKITIFDSSSVQLWTLTTEILNFGSGAQSTIIEVAAENLNITGAYTLKIEVVGSGTTNRQIVIDNFVWTAYAGE